MILMIVKPSAHGEPSVLLAGVVVLESLHSELSEA